MENKENKSNKGIIIGLVVLLLIALGVGGYFGYKYFTNSDNSQQPNNNQQNTNNNNNNQTNNKLSDGPIDINSSLVQDLYNKVSKYNYYSFKAPGGVNTNGGFNENDEKNKILNVDSISYDIKFDMTISGLANGSIGTLNCNDYLSEIEKAYIDNNYRFFGTSCGISSYNENTKKYENKQDYPATTNFYSEDEIKKEMYSIFGKDYYEQRSIASCHFVYIPSKKGYLNIVNGLYCGGYSNEHTDKLIGATKEGDSLFITEQIVFLRYIDLKDVEEEYNFIYTFKYNNKDQGYYLTTVERKFIK